jgi:hypothetical protein
MSSIYARLGFNSSDPLTESSATELTDSVKRQLSMLPPFLNEWQTKDVAEANTSGYYANPLTTTISSIKTTANNMLKIVYPLTGSTTQITTLLANTRVNANTIETTTAAAFLYHTNRLSNVIPPDSNTTEPHYQTAFGVGKMMMYITNQSDGIVNNSPMMGNFTSLYTGNTLSTLQVTAASLVQTLNTSISIVSTPPTVTYSSNITLQQAQTLDAAFADLNSKMVFYRAQDTAFFQNSSLVLTDFNNVRAFSNMGQTETDMILNLIGSDKIKQRLES